MQKKGFLMHGLSMPTTDRFFAHFLNISMGKPMVMIEKQKILAYFRKNQKPDFAHPRGTRIMGSKWAYGKC